MAIVSVDLALQLVEQETIRAARDVRSPLRIRRERRVVQLRFGLLDGHQRSLDEIARRLGF